MICSKEKCTGCYACINVCPKNCIEMKADELGSLYPIIDKDLCVNCGMCKKICPSLNEIILNDIKIAYAGWSLDEYDRKSSSSGGAASVFSQVIIDEGGVVFGVALNNNNVEFIKVENVEDIKRLKGSKYVHGKVEYKFKEVKSELIKNKKVLFIGTPCQISGLRGYLRKDYNNLITVDIVCHGVPSQQLLKDYLRENNINNYDNISFRNEDGFYIKVYNKGTVIFNRDMKKSLYYRGFMSSLFYRENCYICRYAGNKRSADITIGDFWGLGKERTFSKPINDGVSVILGNTKKGIEFIDKCSEFMYLEEREISEAVNGNTQLREPSRKHKNYENYKKRYIKLGFNRAAKKCLMKDIIVDKIKSILRKNSTFYNVLKKCLAR